MHSGLRKKKDTKRGHVSLTWDKITASVTICQVRNKDCGLNGLRGGVQRIPITGTKRSERYCRILERHEDAPLRRCNSFVT